MSQTTFALQKGVRFDVKYSADEQRVFVSDFVTHVTREVDELSFADLKTLKVVRQSRNKAGWVVVSSKIDTLKKHTLIEHLIIDGTAVPLRSLKRPTLLDGRLVPAATADSKVQIKGADVSAMTLNWQDIDKQLHVVSAQHTSRGLMVSRSEMEAVLPAGSIVVGIDWSGTESGSFPQSNTQNIADDALVIQAFDQVLEAAAKKRNKKKTKRQIEEERNLDTEELDHLEMWRAASVMSLAGLLTAVQGIDSNNTLSWTVKVSKPTAPYAAGARIGDTLLAVNRTPIAQSDLGPIQFSANIDHAQSKVDVTVQKFHAIKNTEAATEARRRRQRCLLMNLWTLGVWSKPDAKRMENERFVFEGEPYVPTNLWETARKARLQVHKGWRAEDIGTTGAGIHSVKETYCVTLLSLCMLDPTLAQAVLPVGNPLFAPLEQVKNGHGNSSNAKLRFAHKMLLASLAVAMSVRSEDKEQNDARVRLLPLSYFKKTEAKTSLYRNWIDLMMAKLDFTKSNQDLQVNLRRTPLVSDEQRCEVIVGADILTQTGVINLGFLQEHQPAIVEAMFRLNENPLPNAEPQSNNKTTLGVLERGFGGMPTPALVEHMLTRNKVKWTAPLYQAVVKLLRREYDGDIAQDAFGPVTKDVMQLKRWRLILSRHLSAHKNNLLWYARQTISTPQKPSQKMQHVVYSTTDNKPAELAELRVRVIQQKDIQAILNRVYHKAPECLAKDGLCGQADVEPVSQRERKNVTKTRARGMVSVGINKMEAHVRGLYWGITRKDISSYLNNKEERQLRAPQFKKTGTVKGSLDIGQPVRVAMIAGVTFSRYEAETETRNRQRQYNKAAAAYIKEGQSALSTKYSSRIYKIQSRHAPTSDTTYEHEGKVCQFWQGDSSFFGKKENMNWWPTYHKVPGVKSKQRGEKKYASICLGYVAFIDVFSKYLWIEPLLGEKKPNDKDGGWDVRGGARQLEAKRCFENAVNWCKEEYERAHGKNTSRKGGLALIGGGIDGHPWAPSHSQTDNGTEFALAAAKRLLDETGNVIRYFDLATLKASQFEDRLSDFQRHILRCGGRSHGTSEPTISFRQQRDIETAHKGLKKNLQDFIKANSHNDNYNVRKLAGNTKLQIKLLHRACALYNNSPHRSLPSAGQSQQLTPATIMRYMLHNHGTELGSSNAAAAEALRTEIKTHRLGLMRRRGPEDADRSTYTLLPLREGDYKAANQPVPDRFAFSDEYVHPSTTRFGRHELLPVDLQAMEPMYSKKQQMYKQTSGTLTHAVVEDADDDTGKYVYGRRLMERTAPKKGLRRRMYQAQKNLATIEEEQDEDQAYDATGGVHEPENVLEIEEAIAQQQPATAVAVVSSPKQTPENELQQAVAELNRMITTKNAEPAKPIDAGNNTGQTTPADTSKDPQTSDRTKKTKSDKKKKSKPPVPAYFQPKILGRRSRRRGGRK